jgi:hypothetical protein
MERLFNGRPVLTAFLLMPGNPLRHFVIPWQTGGNKNFIVTVYLFGCLQGICAFSAPAAADHKGQVVHVLNPNSN